MSQKKEYKNVGFDFDGVIHVDVTPTSETGHRHPTIPRNYPAPNKFNEIIDLIHTYHKYNYNIYIITARNSQSRNMVKQTLINFGVSHMIPDENMYFTGDFNGQDGDKVSTLEHLKIRHFYDDSIAHFKSIYNAKKNNKLMYLNKCYLTRPEVRKIIELNI
jgi:hypothetical protein